MEPAEIVRYEDYNRRHGASYADGADTAAMEEDW